MPCRLLVLTLVLLIGLSGCSDHPNAMIGYWESSPHGKKRAVYYMALYGNGKAHYDVRATGKPRGWLDGKWFVSGGDFRFRFYGGGAIVAYQIVELTDTRMILRDVSGLELRFSRTKRFASLDD